MRNIGALTSLSLVLGLGFLLVGRQVLDEGAVAASLTWLGVAGVVGAFALRLLHRGKAPSKAQPAETALVLAYLGVVAALGLYALSTTWGHETLSLESDGRMAGVLAVSWPTLLVVSLCALAFMELAYSRMPIEEAIELRRVRGAAADGLSIALSLVFVVSVNYASTQRDVRKDLSYFKTSRPSDATLQMVRNLGEPIEAVLFYPAVNDVIAQLRPFFEQLDSASENLTVSVRDHALSPELSRQHRIRGNGHVVLLRGEGEGQQAEQFEVGVELERARSRLRTLDGRFQRAFSKLTTVRRELHLTAGHDERSSTGIDGDTPDQRTRLLADALERANLTTERLGMAQGLANRVPEGAPAVAILGPRQPFLPEEVNSLIRYVEDGGRLAVMLDPDEDHGLDPLLAALGVQMVEGILCSERNHRARTFTNADRALVYSNRFSAHPVVTIATRNSNVVASIFVRGGSLTRLEGEDQLEGINVDFPLRSTSMFWMDVDGDYEQDPEEALSEKSMIAAITVPNEDGEEGRAVVIADGDFLTDLVIRNRGNSLVFSDTLNWLIGQEQIVGEVSTEEDVAIEHTSEDDRIWFWATSFGAPLPLFGLAVWVASRRRRRGVRDIEREARQRTLQERTAKRKPTEASSATADDEPAAAADPKPAEADDASADDQASASDAEEPEEGDK